MGFQGDFRQWERTCKGYWSAIDIREGDGWKIRMLTWNMTPPPPATDATTPSPAKQ
jgi:hypothetical protein